MSKFPSQSEIEQMLSGFGRALHPRELASRLKISAEEYSKLIAVLDQLEQEGALKVLPGGRVRSAPRRGKPPTTQANSPAEESWTGEISVHIKGFAFVTATGHDDVFVPPDAVYEAMHRDLVRVRVTGRSRKGLEGCIVEVIERRNTRICGVIRQKGKGSWLEPDDSRVRGPIVLRGDLPGAKDGDAAVINIVRFPQFSEELPEGELLEVLGPQGDPQTEVKKILIREGISEAHSPEALQNAEQMAHRLRATRLGNRRDLRNIPLPTIDPEDARDHDDALWVERTPEGFRAYIAIADVSEYVRAESALDEEARARGCTIYLPDRAIPMLPRALAGDLCSLLPEQDRFCLCVIANLDKDGRTTDFEITEGLMRSCAKLTYAGVARALGWDDESPQSAQAEVMKEDLRVLQSLAEKLRKNRMARGALDLDLPEARIVLDEQTGAPTEIKKRATRPGLKRAYSLVEEMMLLANELVAQWLDKKGAPAIYRVHGKPDPQKLERLASITTDLNVKVDMDELTRPLGVAKFLREIQTHERKYVLEMLLLRSLKQAVYDTKNEGHFGLASERYVHFTSPIRRYPDLRVHRQIKHILRNGPIDKSDKALEDLSGAASESSKRERASMEVEREVSNLYRAVFMKQHIGDEYEGRVTGMSGAGIYVSIDEPCVDVMILFDDLGPEPFELDEQEIGVVGVRSGERVMMGDLIQLIITDAAVLRRTVYARRVLSADALEKSRLGGDEAYRPRAKTFRDDRTAGRSAPGRPAPRARSFKDSDGSRSTPGASSRSQDDRRGPARPSTGRAERANAERASAGRTSAGRPSRESRAGKTPGERASAPRTAASRPRNRTTKKSSSRR